MSWSVGISTGGCYVRPILDVLESVIDSGASGVELGTPPRHFDPWQNSQVDAVAARLAHAPLRPVSIHAPFGGALDLSDPDERHRHATMGAISAAGLALKRLGGHIVVVHPTDVVRHSATVDARLATCAGTLRALAEGFRQETMTLAIESPLPHLVGGHPDEFAWLLSQVDPSAAVCLDTGHTALGHHWHRFVEISRGRLVHVHASDNHGRYDDHLPPGEGRLDWTSVAGSLRDAAFAGWVMLELRCPDGDLAPYFRDARLRTVALLDQ